MESMTPHDTFLLESFILNFKLFAPKCSALSPINLGVWLSFCKINIERIAAKIVSISLLVSYLSRIDI